jgi:predicted TIM-barrel fold metal-dependent hydrolase
MIADGADIGGVTPRDIAAAHSSETSARGYLVLHADHHTHLMSPAAADRVRTIQEFAPHDADELLSILDADGVSSALVLSTAYFFAMPDLGAADVPTLKAENDWIAQEVTRHPDRLRGCCSVNPLIPGATDEVARCAKSAAFVGVKLHFANSAVDLRDRAHLAAIGEVFDTANALHLALVVHMRTRRPDYGAEDARAFIDELMPRAPAVAVQVAHGAGWGGYDAGTDGALGEFASWAAAHRAPAERLFIDSSGVALPREFVERVLPGALDAIDLSALALRYGRLAVHLRKLGLTQVLFGTDWPVFTPTAHFETLRGAIPLGEAEFDQIAANNGPWAR